MLCNGADNVDPSGGGEKKHKCERVHLQTHMYITNMKCITVYISQLYTELLCSREKGRQSEYQYTVMHLCMYVFNAFGVRNARSKNRNFLI